jgi:hypothetical protein
VSFKEQAFDLSVIINELFKLLMLNRPVTGSNKININFIVNGVYENNLVSF